MSCATVLQDVGFALVQVPPPIQPSKIQGEYLRTHIHREWCCGHDEFIKLHAFALPEPIVAHVDIDFAFLQPMDPLFDAQAARAKIPLEQASSSSS
jgi:hypothetical protein